MGNTIYTGWCGDYHLYIMEDTDHNNTLLYNSYNDSLPLHLANDFWPEVNYILNNKIGDDWKQIQIAIWYVLGFGDQGLEDDGWQMVNDAIANGENYIPGVFDAIAIIGDVGEDIQPQIFELYRIDPNGDIDGDGIINIDEDIDQDGDPENDDTDGDGIPNYLDPDDEDGPLADPDGDGLIKLLPLFTSSYKRDYENRPNAGRTFDFDMALMTFDHIFYYC